MWIQILYPTKESVNGFDYDELNSLEMPFTAQYVIRHYLETGRLNDKVYGGIADGEKVVFIEMPEF